MSTVYTIENHNIYMKEYGFRKKNQKILTAFYNFHTKIVRFYPSGHSYQTYVDFLEITRSS